MPRQPEPERRPSALERIMAEEAEVHGWDYVRGLTDKPERRAPTPERQPIFERPTGPEDYG